MAHMSLDPKDDQLEENGADGDKSAHMSLDPNIDQLEENGAVGDNREPMRLDYNDDQLEENEAYARIDEEQDAGVAEVMQVCMSRRLEEGSAYVVRCASRRIKETTA